MTKRPKRLRNVGRAAAEVYFHKSSEFFKAMHQALQSGLWSAAGLNAVHCAISACDAVLSSRTGQRSASTDHEEAVHYLSSVAELPEAKQKSDTLRKILQKKHLVEYEERAVSASEAAELAKLTERFYRWAESLIK